MPHSEAHESCPSPFAESLQRTFAGLPSAAFRCAANDAGWNLPGGSRHCLYFAGNKMEGLSSIPYAMAAQRAKRHYYSGLVALAFSYPSRIE
jgi:hypothetical protein